MEQKEKSPWLFYGFYFIIFLGSAIYGSFLPLYMKNAGMSESLLGLVQGINQVVCFIVVPLWGLLADLKLSPKKVLIIALSLCACILVLFYFTDQVWMLAILMVVFAACNTPTGGIYETLAVNYARRTGRNYSPIRMSGTIGYAVMAALLGFVLGEQEDLLFIVYFAVTLLVIAFTFFLPDAKTQKYSSAGSRFGVYSMLKDKEVLLIMFLFMIYMMSNSFNITFFAIHLTENLGGNYAMVGIANAIMAIAEIPFHIGPGRRWLRRIGVKNSLIIVTFVGVVRWTVAALSNDPWVFVFTMAFNGIMLVPTIVSVVEFLYERAPEHLKTSAQTGLKTLFSIGGSCIANIFGGMLVQHLNGIGMQGIRIGYAVLIPLNLIVAIAVTLMTLRQRKQKKPDEIPAA